MRRFVICMAEVALMLIFGISGSLAQQSSEQLVEQVNLSMKQKSSDLDLPACEAIFQLAKRLEPKAKQPEVIDALVSTGANCLNDQAAWADSKRGRIIYDTLKKLDGKLVTDSLARKVIKGTNRLHVLFVGVKLGIPGSQERLNRILMNHGDKKMAEDFLNSGSKELFEGGREWANTHGYSINTGMGSHRVGWGQF